MSTKKEVIVLTNRWEEDAIKTIEVDMTEVVPDTFMAPPFPLSLEAQRRLLELIYTRKSGIITRQELINVLFDKKHDPCRTIIRNAG